MACFTIHIPEQGVINGKMTASEVVEHLHTLSVRYLCSVHLQGFWSLWKLLVVACCLAD